MRSVESVKRKTLIWLVLVVALSQQGWALVGCAAGFCLPGHHPAEKILEPAASPDSCHAESAAVPDGAWSSLAACCAMVSGTQGSPSGLSRAATAPAGPHLGTSSLPMSAFSLEWVPTGGGRTWKRAASDLRSTLAALGHPLLL